MDDCISRKAAIDAIENAFDRETILNRFVRKIAISAVRKLPSAQPEQRWIPCSERLPENEEDSLVTDGESMAVGYYRQDAKAWDNADFGWIENREKGYGINEVIAWMPLPEPYKSESEG